MLSFRFILLSTLISGILAAPIIPHSETSEHAASLFDENPRTSLETRNEEVTDNFADIQSRSTRIRAEIIAKNTGNDLDSRGTEASEDTRDFDPRELKEVEEVDNLQTRNLEVDEDFASIEGRAQKQNQGGSTTSTRPKQNQGGGADAAARARVSKETKEINDIRAKEKAQAKTGQAKEADERKEISDAGRAQAAAKTPKAYDSAQLHTNKEKDELNAVKAQNQRDKSRLDAEMVKEKGELQQAKAAEEQARRAGKSGGIRRVVYVPHSESGSPETSPIPKSCGDRIKNLQGEELIKAQGNCRFEPGPLVTTSLLDSKNSKKQG